MTKVPIVREMEMMRFLRSEIPGRSFQLSRYFLSLLFMRQEMIIARLSSYPTCKFLEHLKNNITNFKNEALQLSIFSRNSSTPDYAHRSSNLFIASKTSPLNLERSSPKDTSALGFLPVTP